MTTRALAGKAAEIIVNREFATRAFAALIFFFLVLFLFIYLRFPTGELAPYIERAIQDSAKPLRVLVGEVKRDFPFGIKANGINIIETLPNKNRPLFHIDSVTIHPSFFALLTGGLSGGGSIELLGGLAGYRGEIDGKDNIAFQIDFDGLEIGEIAAWDDFIWAKVTGKLAGKGNLSAPKGDIQKGEGSISANLGEGTLEITETLASGLAPAKIDGGQIIAELKDGRISFKRFVINGPELSIEGGGDIILNKNPLFSTLQLKFSVDLSGDLGKKLNPFLSILKPGKGGKKILKIGGSAARPKIS